MMSDTLIFGVAAVVIAIVIGAAVILGGQEDAKWQAFAKSHDCKVSGKVSPTSSVGVGIGTNGQVSIVPISTPGKTGYTCNDGVTYWR